MTGVRPFDPAVLEDPYPMYEALQREAPVFQIPEVGIWLVTRHDDLVEATSNPDVFSSHISAIFYAGEGTNPAVIPADPDAIGAVDVLATQDPPAHSLQRRLVSRGFAPAKIASYESHVREFVEREIARSGGSIDWMEAVANPLPVSLIGAILGLPFSDYALLKGWADAGVDLLSGVATPERMLEAWGQMTGFLAYLREALAAPQAGTVTTEIAGGVERGDLTDREGVSLMLQLVIAGSESTASLLGSSVRILAERRELQARLRDEPSLIPAFLEEALRLESPFRGHFRVVTQDTTLGGVELPAGSRVMLMWGAANRDSRAFVSPAAVDLGRENPKLHVAFGNGIHFCIGAPLARLEARIAVEILLERTTSFSIAGEAPRHIPSLFVRRLSALRLNLR